MRECLTLFAAVSAISLLTAEPSVSADSVHVSRTASGAVKISYTLTGEPAVITIDIQTNTQANAAGSWVSMDGTALASLAGAVNRPVSVLGEESVAYWFPAKSMAGAAGDALRVTVNAWPTTAPPDYMVADLTHPDVRFYVSTNALPGGLGNPAYRRDKLVMRKIPAKGVVWLMGSPNKLTDLDNATINNFAHKVRLTSDYYAGVFELTQGQLEALGCANNSKFAAEANYEALPAERLGWRSIYAMMDVLRVRSGIVDMDLPTEAQWEYACHAGCGGELHNGLPWTESNLKKIAWFKANASKTKPVGLLAPNAFGLYDMLGNVWEFTKDAMGINSGGNYYLESYQSSLASDWATGGITDDPPGATNESGRKMKRGGSWYEGREDEGGVHRSNFRSDASTYWDEGPGGNVGYIGCRVFCSADGAVAGANGCPQAQ